MVNPGRISSGLPLNKSHESQDTFCDDDNSALRRMKVTKDAFDVAVNDDHCGVALTTPRESKSPGLKVGGKGSDDGGRRGLQQENAIMGQCRAVLVADKYLTSHVCLVC